MVVIAGGFEARKVISVLETPLSVSLRALMVVLYNGILESRTVLIWLHT